MDVFLKALEQSLTEGSFVGLTLSYYTGDEKELTRILLRRVIIKREDKLSFTYRYKTRDIVKNHTAEESMVMVRSLVPEPFRAATLATVSFDMQLQNNGGKITVRKTGATHTAPVEAAHDRRKRRFIEPEGKFYLRALGITDAEGKVLKNAQDKYRQIDKYVEIVSGLIGDIAPGGLTKIVDMGCGKGYLTFALYDYVTHTLGLTTEVIGVDTRADMVALCGNVARESAYANLRFVQDTIAQYDASGVTLLIALHACDTATDEAIAKGVKAGAEVIVVAPCCHKQIRRQMDANPVSNDVGFLTRHGIFAERQAEMVTDGLRAMMLEYFGYAVKVFEFIAGEHTPKNVMIVATKRKNAFERDPALLANITAAKNYFAIGYHALERMLAIGNA